MVLYLSPFIPAEEHECIYENTKTELLSVTEIGDDEIDDASEEATEINEPDPPTKKKSKLSQMFAKKDQRNLN